MPTDTHSNTHSGEAERTPDATADDETTGTTILAAHARAEMRNSVVRLKGELRAVFSASAAALKSNETDTPDRS